MKKRKFIQLLGTGLLGTIMTPFTPGAMLSSGMIQQKSYKNWTWIGGSTKLSDDEWKARFEKMRRLGIDAVLVQVYNGHIALFDHPDPIVPVEADILGKLIQLADSAGLELHAWMWTMPCNNLTIIEKHPDWFAVNGNGEPSWSHPAYVNYYKFLCPCHPEAMEFVTGNVKALAAYEELDGIHLDYVRLPDVILAEALQPKYDIVQDKEYPQYDYSYSDYYRNRLSLWCRFLRF